jgi:cytochrome c peroxidase
VWNAAFQARQFWDGRAPSLEEQAKGPPVNPIEMGMHSLDDVVARVAEAPTYRAAFTALLGGGHMISIADVVGAIAVYERTLVTADSPYDRYARGDANALDTSQRRGMRLFESVGCVICHHGPNFSSASVFDARMPYRLFPAFQNDYIDRYDLGQDLGRAPKGPRALWKVPSLRNVALTAPYFHNGKVRRLEEAVRVMAATQLGRRVVASEADKQYPRDLGESEVRDLAAFLRALSSPRLAAVR